MSPGPRDSPSLASRDSGRPGMAPWATAEASYGSVGPSGRPRTVASFELWQRRCSKRPCRVDGRGLGGPKLDHDSSGGAGGGRGAAPQDHPTIILGADEIVLGVDESSVKIAPNGPYEVQKTPPKCFLIKLPMSPGPRDGPSLANRDGT